MKQVKWVIHKFKKWWQVAAALICLMETLVLAEWSARSLSGEILFDNYSPVFEHHQPMVTAIVVFLLAVALIVLYALRGYLLQPMGFHEDVVSPHRCLIVPLTSPIRKHEIGTISISPKNGRWDFGIKGKKIPQGQEIRKDIKELDGTGWAWQQFLRCIEPHQNKLEAVYLIGTEGKSDGTPGSYDYLGAVEFLIRHYIKTVKHVIPHKEAVNIDRFNPLCAAIKKGILKLNDMDYAEDDIIIDVTGASKIVSIAGASVTMDKAVMFQYVQTEAEKGQEPKVLAYDVIAGRSAPSAE